MAAKYWIKLYHEILHDPKMARMPDNLWRLTIELFLLAGENNSDGELPPIEDIAWTLRDNPEHVETNMIELQRLGILSMSDGVWSVTKFIARQEPLPKDEYMRRKRGNEQREEYYDGVLPEVTEPVTNSHVDTDTDTDTDKKRKDINTAAAISRPNVYSVYEREIGALTGTIANYLDAALKDYPEEWIVEAFQESARQNKRSWAYASAILKNRQAGGTATRDKTNGSKSSKPVDTSLDDLIRSGK